jgi:membrane protease subunit HflK
VNRQRWGLLLVLWLLTGVYVVPADEQAVVTRFGRVAEPRALPGIHYSLPWPIDRVSRLKVQQLQRLIVGGDPSDAVLGRLEPSTSQFLTGDQNLIHLRVAVQFSVATPREYLFTADDVKRAVGAAVESELSRRVGQRGVDAVLTTEKIAVQEEVRGAAQKLVDQYRLGVALASVNIESAQPPPEARDAFNDVASARADSARIVNEALGYTGDIVPKARGEASQSLQAAIGYREKKVNEARGDADRFKQVAAEYERAAAINGRRLYTETMEQVLPKIKKILVDSRGNLDLTIVRKP